MFGVLCVVRRLYEARDDMLHLDNTTHTSKHITPIVMQIERHHQKVTRIYFQHR
jgi:hypothetical protein